MSPCELKKIFLTCFIFSSLTVAVQSLRLVHSFLVCLNLFLPKFELKIEILCSGCYKFLISDDDDGCSWVKLFLSKVLMLSQQIHVQFSVLA